MRASIKSDLKTLFRSLWWVRIQVRSNKPTPSHLWLIMRRHCYLIIPHTVWQFPSIWPKFAEKLKYHSVMFYWLNGIYQLSPSIMRFSGNSFRIWNFFIHLRDDFFSVFFACFGKLHVRSEMFFRHDKEVINIAVDIDFFQNVREQVIPQNGIAQFFNGF